MNDIKEELLSLYTSGLEEAAGYYLIFNPSQEDEYERITNDIYKIAYFKELLCQI